MMSRLCMAQPVEIRAVGNDSRVLLYCVKDRGHDGEHQGPVLFSDDGFIG